jgi:hypothetical protein
MIENAQNLEIGSTIYQYCIKNNVMNRGRFTTIIDGEEWYRYSKPVWSIEIYKLEFVGLIMPAYVGAYALVDFYFKMEDGKILNTSEPLSSNIVLEQYSISEDDAINLAQMQLEQLKND